MSKVNQMDPREVLESLDCQYSRPTVTLAFPSMMVRELNHLSRDNIYTTLINKKYLRDIRGLQRAITSAKHNVTKVHEQSKIDFNLT